MKNKLPEDIVKKIEELFTNTPDKKTALKIIRELFDQQWGVGQDQLARSLLLLSEGNPIALKKTMDKMDPRDIIMSAEAKAGNPGHYFIPPFDQMEK